MTVNTANGPLSMEGRILKPPTLKYGGTGAQTTIVGATVCKYTVFHWTEKLLLRNQGMDLGICGLFTL